MPGVDVPPNNGFQYREPPEDASFMREDEYDRLIDDPLAFFYEVWLPRATRKIAAAGEPVTFRHNVSFRFGGDGHDAVLQRLRPALCAVAQRGRHARRDRRYSKRRSTSSATKLRGYIGLTMDMYSQPEKVMKACEALMPHPYWVAAATADPSSQLPIGYWMHRGCVPFVRPDQFASHYWGRR